MSAEEISEEDVEKMTVIEYARRFPPKGWEELFESSADELELVSSILEKKEKLNGTFIPERKNLFRVFELCQAQDIKVVIIGQDPYHQILADGKPRAQGLAFSVSQDDEVPISLKNIYKELKNDVGVDNYLHGDLTFWVEGGVFLLNSCLTVDPGKAGSHKAIWMPFITNTLKFIAKHNEHVIYLLWGNSSQDLEEYIEGSPVILTASHPSGFSANRGFFGSKHFSQVNQILIKQGREPIDWKLPV